MTRTQRPLKRVGQWSSLLVLVFVLTMLAGCTDSNKPDSSPTDNQTSTTQPPLPTLLQFSQEITVSGANAGNIEGRRFIALPGNQNCFVFGGLDEVDLFSVSATATDPGGTDYTIAWELLVTLYGLDNDSGSRTVRAGSLPLSVELIDFDFSGAHEMHVFVQPGDSPPSIAVSEQVELSVDLLLAKPENLASTLDRDSCAG